MGERMAPPSPAALQVRCKKPCTKLKVWGNFTLGQSGDPAWKMGGMPNQTLGHRITCEQGRAGIAGPWLHPAGTFPHFYIRPRFGFGVFGWGSAKHGGGVVGKRHETWCETRSVLPWYSHQMQGVAVCAAEDSCNVGLWTKTCRCRRLCVCVFEVTQIPSQPRSATGAATVEKPIPACAAVSSYDAPLALHFNTGPILTRYNTLNLI